MSVAVLCRRHPGALAGAATPAGLVLRTVCADRDALPIARLADAVAAAAAGQATSSSALRPRGPGLAAELRSRPGRLVEAWLAIVPTADDDGGFGMGLISLIRGRSANGLRHSIGWVLVHPAARRRGLGRALVTHACRRAARLAAHEVWVECRADWADAMAFWRSVGFEDRRAKSPVAAGAHQPHE